jgi:hypothetical protein
MIKHKHLSNFDYFSLWSDDLFGSFFFVTAPMIIQKQKKLKGPELKKKIIDKS